MKLSTSTDYEPDYAHPDEALRERKLLAALAPLGAPASVRVLDYGCGNGRMVAFLHARGYAVEGADLVSPGLTRARERCPNVPFTELEIDQPAPYPDSTFDTIYCSEVIEHVYDTAFVFSELARLLRPGGLLILTTPYHGLVKNLVIVLICFDHHFDVTWEHIRFWTRHSLTTMTHQHGLEPVHWSHVGRCWPVPRSFFVTFRRRV